MRVDLDLEVGIARSPRVKQVEGIFDVPEAKRQTVAFHFDVPLDAKPWQVGLITGLSGAGKSSVARALFGKNLVEDYSWPRDGAVVDAFGDLPVNDIVGALSAVGFASPPGWLKPYRVLSNGERFRVNLARAIVDPRPLIAVDEFSSVVDRQVAKVGAHATQRAVRARKGKRFVAVTCHDDVMEWLQPDWILEPHAGRFAWRLPQRRPPVVLEVVRCTTAAWRWFSAHHYLSADIHRGARCFAALIDGKPAAFSSLLAFPHATIKNGRRVHRTVVLPDYQGLGIGLRLNELVGAVCRSMGFKLLLTTSHPALIRSCARSKLWDMRRAPSVAPRHTGEVGERQKYTPRKTAGFEYVGPKWPSDRDARRLYA